MSNAAGVRPLHPIDSYTRKLLNDFEAAVFARAIAMSSPNESEDNDQDIAQYNEANRAYRHSKSALIRRISKLTATPTINPEEEPEPCPESDSE